MTRFGLRLALRGGREAIARLLVMAAAVALGVGLLLTSLAAVNAVSTQNDRNAWLNTGALPSSSQPRAGVDPMWWSLRQDGFDGKVIGLVDVAATGPNSPVPPGMQHLPAPGEYYVSPAMDKLLRDTPADQLRDRYPGHETGLIGNSALPSPDSLIVVVGHTPDELASVPGAKRVSSVATTSPASCSGCYVGIDSNGMALILPVAGGALILPILVLIGTATRLSAARREQRFAAMRLVGATPRQISVIAGVESAVAAALGVAVGFALFYALRPVTAQLPFTGERFFLSDLSLNALDIVLTVAGVPLAAAVASRIALRRVRISPLGVSRRVTPKKPSAWRVVPLLAGIAELAWFVGRRPPTVDGQVAAYLTGFVVIMAGLVVAGPWLTMVGARLLARRTSRPATLIAARRLADDPRAGFRAVSGLILALFVTTVAVAVIGSMVHNRSVPSDGTADRDVLVLDVTNGRNQDGSPVATAAAPSHTLVARLRAVPGVEGVAVMYADPAGPRPSADPRRAPETEGLVSCDQLASLALFGSCTPGATVGEGEPDFNGYDQRHQVWAASRTTDLTALHVIQVGVATDGSHAAIEQARTILADAYPGARSPGTLGELHAQQTAQLAGYERLADVVILASLPIAGCGLAVSVAGGIAERKRPFSLLRLTGAPLRMLRRVVALESVVPLVAAAVVAIGTGFLAAHLFLRAQLGYELIAPDSAYYLLVAGGLVASLGIIASTLPLLRRVTGPEAARNA